MCIRDSAKRGARFSIDQLESFEAIGKSNDISWGNELQTFNSSELRDGVDNNDRNSSWRSLRIAGEGTVDLTAERWDSTTFFNIYTETGTQTLIGTSNSDRFYAGNGNDVLYGHSGDDILLGQKGNDELYGGSGDDLIEGNGGYDILYGGEGSDILIGGGRKDSVYGEKGSDIVELNWGSFNHRNYDQGYGYDNGTIVIGTYDGGEGSDTLRIQADGWWGNGEGQRGEGYTIDLRDATINNFERLEVGTAAILRLTGAQYSQFTSGISKVAGYEGSTNLAIDLEPGEELKFSRSAGINNASGALKIIGTSEIF